MKKNLLAIFLLFQLNIFSQNTEWVQAHGDNYAEKGISIGTDSLGFVYIAGYFNGSITFGSFNLVGVGTHDKAIFVAKMDSLGNYIWAIMANAYYDDRALGLDIAPDGTVYVAGTFSGYLDVQATNGLYTIPNLNTSGGNWASHDGSFILKLDTDGNAIWGKTFGSQNGWGCPWWNMDDHAYDVKVDRDNNIYVTGFFSGFSAEFDAISLPNTNWNNDCHPLGYVAKMDEMVIFCGLIVFKV